MHFSAIHDICIRPMYQNEIDSWKEKNLCVFAIYSSFDKKKEEVKADPAESDEEIDESEIGDP